MCVYVIRICLLCGLYSTHTHTQLNPTTYGSAASSAPTSCYLPCELKHASSQHPPVSLLSPPLSHSLAHEHNQAVGFCARARVHASASRDSRTRTVNATYSPPKKHRQHRHRRHPFVDTGGDSERARYLLVVASCGARAIAVRRSRPHGARRRQEQQLPVSCYFVRRGRTTEPERECVRACVTELPSENTARVCVCVCVRVRAPRANKRCDDIHRIYIKCMCFIYIYVYVCGMCVCVSVCLRASASVPRHENISTNPMIYTRLVDDAVDGIVVVVPRESLSINGVDGVFLRTVGVCALYVCSSAVHRSPSPRRTRVQNSEQSKPAQRANERFLSMSVLRAPPSLIIECL